MPNVDIIFQFDVPKVGLIRHRRVVRRDIYWFVFKKQKHVITLCSFSSFQTPADTSNIHRKACTGARIDGSKHTHTQLMIVTNIIEREFVATDILSYRIYFVGGCQKAATRLASAASPRRSLKCLTRCYL